MDLNMTKVGFGYVFEVCYITAAVDFRINNIHFLSQWVESSSPACRYDAGVIIGARCDQNAAGAEWRA
jgi:hypothetical protein